MPRYVSNAPCVMYPVCKSPLSDVERLNLVSPPPLLYPPTHPHPSLELLVKDVGEEYQHSCGQQPDGTLVDGDDVLQGVDALLHGVGVDVVINGGPDAPHRPYSVHHRFHGGRDH